MSLEHLLHEEITPMSLLGSHTHLAGEIMAGFGYMHMAMNHNMEGSQTVSDADVLARYPVAHTSMTMDMYMFDLMYAPSDYVTVMGMIPYKVNTMNHLTRTGAEPVAHSSGIGDVDILGLFNLLGDPRTKGQRLVLDAGFSAPTGSIGASEGGNQLEYNMQLGGGTWALLPGLTYLGESDDWAWGAQVLCTVPVGMNNHDYRLGNRYRLGAWTELKVANWFGPSVRLDYQIWSNIYGADPAMNPARNPAFDATKQSGERLSFLAGLNFYVPSGLLKGTRFYVEGGVPVYQNIAGPNLAADWMIGVGVTYTFH